MSKNKLNFVAPELGGVKQLEALDIEGKTKRDEKEEDPDWQEGGEKPQKRSARSRRVRIPAVAMTGGGNGGNGSSEDNDVMSQDEDLQSSGKGSLQKRLVPVGGAAGHYNKLVEEFLAGKGRGMELAEIALQGLTDDEFKTCLDHSSVKVEFDPKEKELFVEDRKAVVSMLNELLEMSDSTKVVMFLTKIKHPHEDLKRRVRAGYNKTERDLLQRAVRKGDVSVCSLMMPYYFTTEIWKYPIAANVTELVMQHTPLSFFNQPEKADQSPLFRLHELMPASLRAIASREDVDWNQVNDNGATPLIHFIKTDAEYDWRTENKPLEWQMSLLLSLGMDINRKYGKGYSAFLTAAEFGNFEVFLKLFRAGGDVRSKTKANETVALLVTKRSQRERDGSYYRFLKVLMQSDNVDLDTRSKNSGRTPLISFLRNKDNEEGYNSWDRKDYNAMVLWLVDRTNALDAVDRYNKEGPVTAPAYIAMKWYPGGGRGDDGALLYYTIKRLAIVNKIREVQDMVMYIVSERVDKKGGQGTMVLFSLMGLHGSTFVMNTGTQTGYFVTNAQEGSFNFQNFWKQVAAIVACAAPNLQGVLGAANMPPEMKLQLIRQMVESAEFTVYFIEGDRRFTGSPTFKEMLAGLTTSQWLNLLLPAISQLYLKAEEDREAFEKATVLLLGRVVELMGKNWDNAPKETKEYEYD